MAIAPTNPVGAAGGSGPFDAAQIALHTLDPAVPGAGALAGRTVTQTGNILQGNGMPFPTIGHVGNFYVDLTDGALHVRLGSFGIFHVWSDPIAYPSAQIFPTLKYYGSGPPDPNVGNIGDYYLQTGFGQNDLTYIGPKTASGW